MLAIGNFDGVHRGHAKVIRRAVAEAEERGVDAAVLTFEPHPVLVFRPDTPEFRLTSLEQKAQLLAELGIAGVVAATFDRQLASLSPEKFVQQILVDALDVSAVLVGEDFRFGSKRAGDTDALRRLGGSRFDVITLEEVRADDEVISSTRIREALRNADLALVERLLGRPYGVRGTVEHGDALGRTFGFPTANVDPETPLLPPDGIYAAKLRCAEQCWDAAAYIGTRPAVDGTARVVEAFCLGVEGELDLYDAVVELDFLAWIRGDRDFESEAGLIEQMKRDVAAVEDVLRSRR